ncbi:MAG: 1,4-dihydroxy-2-naphthoate polyprenyltransferase [Cytophagaceae bacterium]
MTSDQLKAWIKASRLRTLPLSLSSIGMGGFLAAWEHSFKPVIFLFCVLTTILLQVLSNLANDYGDFKNGADSVIRKGPQRAVQSGIISPKSMKRAIILFSLLSLVSGVYLLYLGLDITFNFLGFFLLGLLAILAAIKYTAGRNPYGYAGFGDVSVFLFFGLVGVLGTCFLQSSHLDPAMLFPAASCGLFSVAVLNINNIRDIESDAEAGKKSIPVRLGPYKARIYHWSLLFAGCCCALIFTWYRFSSGLQLIYLISFILMLRNGMVIWKTQEPHLIDPYLKQMSLSTLFFVLTFGVGLLLS